MMELVGTNWVYAGKVKIQINGWSFNAGISAELRIDPDTPPLRVRFADAEWNEMKKKGLLKKVKSTNS